VSSEDERSMKITEVRPYVVTRHYDGSLRNPLHSWSGKSYFLVSVHTEDGSFGLGEMFLDGQSSPQVLEIFMCEEVAPLVIGEDAQAIGAIRQRFARRMSLSGNAGALSCAMSAIDIALWDLLGKATGLPVWKLMGGCLDRVQVYASGGMYGASITPASLASDMSRAVAAGLGGAKIKAAGATLGEDIERITAVREAIGPGKRLMIDAMFVPDLPAAIRLAKAIEPYDIYFLEAPTDPRDLRGWGAIRKATEIPLAGPELQWSADVMRDFLTTDAVQFLQFDVTLAGGLSQGRDLAALARSFHRTVTLHCSTSAIGTAATAQLAAAVPNCDSVEYHAMHHGLHGRLFSSGWRFENGALVIPDRPGLGLDFTTADLAGLRAMHCDESPIN
jgi:L-alanine-DL-glutamate epimerase-like enolase superfamily enzyme